MPCAVACLLWSLSLALSTTTPVFADNLSESDSLTVNVESGGGIRAVAQVFFPAKPEIIQAILTDYGHWPELFDVRMKIASLAIEHGVATMIFESSMPCCRESADLSVSRGRCRAGD